ncbi:MAG: hypothetical protein KGJ90_03845 [Patescibacteria group bacterium]|nr:hypothetical protein [Patescibacteria group bacterium]
MTRESKLDHWPIVLPTQIRRRHTDNPIHNLMIEILRDAIKCYQTKSKAGRRYGKQYLDSSAGDWLFDDLGNGVCSIRTICETLSLDLSALRAKLKSGVRINTNSFRYIGPTRG